MPEVSLEDSGQAERGVMARVIMMYTYSGPTNGMSDFTFKILETGVAGKCESKQGPDVTLALSQSNSSNMVMYLLT